MILADKLIDLRKKSGWSQEELAERLGVSRQSISKWEGAQSVPDMNRILLLADVFGVSTDYLLRDDMEPSEAIVPTTDTEAAPARRVSMEEANAFLTERSRTAGQIALGVMLCILSPVLLILAGGAQQGGYLPIPEAHAAALGLAVLLLLVAAAVALFVTCHLRMKRYEYLEREYIDTEYGVSGMARERLERYQPTYARLLVLGIVLCVLSAAPLFALAAIDSADIYLVAATAALLVTVSVGVLLIVKCTLTRAGLLQLLEEGDYTRENKREAARNANITKIYWGAVTAAYLIWSFLSGRWDMTWIVWAVSGILYGVLCAVLKAIRKNP